MKYYVEIEAKTGYEVEAENEEEAKEIAFIYFEQYMPKVIVEQIDEGQYLLSFLIRCITSN